MILALLVSLYALTAISPQIRALGPTTSSLTSSVQVYFDSMSLTETSPQAYSFGVKAKTSPGLSIVKLSWQFGDGSSKDSPYCCQSQVSEVQYHSYSQQGPYAVSVSAVDSKGNSGSAQTMVNWSTGQKLDSLRTSETVHPIPIVITNQ